MEEGDRRGKGVEGGEGREEMREKGNGRKRLKKGNDEGRFVMR